jgi:hypothetical protein
MKKLYALSVFIFGLSFGLYAQTPAAEDGSCYYQYLKVFELRGAQEATDGTYDDVVISIRKGTRTDCYTGKVIIEKKFIRTMYIKFSDGNYDLFEPLYKFKEDIIVVSGKSKTQVTVDDQLIDVFFPKLLKPKKKAYERAPLPSLDDL